MSSCITANSSAFLAGVFGLITPLHALPNTISTTVENASAMPDALVVPGNLVNNGSFNSSLNSWIHNPSETWWHNGAARMISGSTGVEQGIWVSEGGTYRASFACKRSSSWRPSGGQYWFGSSSLSQPVHAAAFNGGCGMYSFNEHTELWFVPTGFYDLNVRHNLNYGLDVDDVSLAWESYADNISSGLVKNGDFIGYNGWIFTGGAGFTMDASGFDAPMREGAVYFPYSNTDNKTASQIISIPIGGDYRFTFDCKRLGNNSPTKLWVELDELGSNTVYLTGGFCGTYAGDWVRSVTNYTNLNPGDYRLTFELLPYSQNTQYVIDNVRMAADGCQDPISLCGQYDPESGLKEETHEYYQIHEHLSSTEPTRRYSPQPAHNHH